MLKSIDPNADIDFVGAFEHWGGMAVFPQGYEPRIDSFFEHGQWWVHDIESGATWSAYDTDDNGEHDIAFEQVSDGDFTAFHNEQARLADG